jgi:hypothetical protein
MSDFSLSPGLVFLVPEMALSHFGPDTASSVFLIAWL